MAAKGRIDGDNIHVTGFKKEDLTKEEIYLVNVSGTSTADGSYGKTVVSNTAIIKHQRHATITLSSPIMTGDMSGYFTITTKNIVEDSVIAMVFPYFVSEYTITKTNCKTSSTGIKTCTYRLKFSMNVNYGSTESGGFIVGGKDEYGNIIVSNEGTIENKPVEIGKICLKCINEDTEAAEIEATDTFYRAVCSGTSEIIISSVTVNEKTDNIVSTSFVKYPGAENKRYLDIVLEKNGSTTTTKIYKISIKALNKYGDLVYSNDFTIYQKPKEKSSSFYVTGDNVPYSATTATFEIYYPTAIDPLSIGIYDMSSGITGISSISLGRNPATVVVTMDENTSSAPKELTIYVSGKTTNDTILYADGTIFQEQGAILLVQDDAGDWVSATTSVNKSNYYSQVRTFKYKSMNVTGIKGYLTSGKGSVSLNSSTNTATVLFSRNEDEVEKEFVVTISGATGFGTQITATYEFKQDAYGSGDFMLVTGATLETNGNIKPEATSFELTIVNGNLYSHVGVSLNTSHSTIYKVWRTQVSEDKKTLTCYVYQNNSEQSWPYELQVSGITDDNKVIYTNVFNVTHLTSASTGSIYFSPSASANVNYTATEYTGIRFNYTNLKNIQVSDIDVSDGSYAGEYDFNVSDGSGSGTLSVRFSAYPATKKTIKITLSGYDDTGEIRTTEIPFIITQEASGEPRIEINPNPKQLPSWESQTFTYEVNYINVTPDSPIYDTTIFSGVGNTSAKTLIDNNSFSPVSYTITFRGTSNIDGSMIYNELVVIIPPEASCYPLLEISSKESLLNEDGKYVVSIYGGIYPLNINSRDIDPSTLKAVVTPEGNAEVNIYTENIIFDEFEEGQTGQTPDRPTYIGKREGDTIYIPVGNTAKKYNAKLFQIEKDDLSKLTDGTYVYEVELDVYNDEPLTNETTVYLTGESYCGEQISSNSLTFLQIGKTEDEEDDGTVYKITILDDLTSGTTAKIDFDNTFIPIITYPYETGREEGYGIRIIAYADGYGSQIIVDTESMSKDDEYIGTINLQPLLENDLIVHFINYSSQSSNRYIEEKEVGYHLYITPRIYYASSTYKQCRVSLIIDHGGDYEIVLPDYARYIIEKNLGTNTKILFVEYSLDDITDTQNSFTITNGTITYTIHVNFKNPEDN